MFGRVLQHWQAQGHANQQRGRQNSQLAPIDQRAVLHTHQRRYKQVQHQQQRHRHAQAHHMGQERHCHQVGAKATEPEDRIGQGHRHTHRPQLEGRQLGQAATNKLHPGAIRVNCTGSRVKARASSC